MIGRSRSRDERDYAALMAEASPDLLTYFERRVGADGADLLAETMLIAWRRRSELPREVEPARMWLFGVARNVLRNAARSEARRERLGGALRDVLTTRSVEDPADVVAMRDLLERLAPDLAEIVTLVHWDGWSLVEIGRLLGMPASTVRGRYQRAKEELRAQLAVRAPR